MEFGLDVEQQDFVAGVREFMSRHRTPELMSELAMRDLDGTVGPETRRFLDALKEEGYNSLAWPKEYGGQGANPFLSWLLMDELGYWGLPSGPSFDMIGATIMRFGTEEQKHEWLPKVQAGEMRFCLGYTEPNAGTDLASLQARAVRDGDEYVINGQKIYTSGAHHATHVWFAARTDPNAPKHRGVSMFVVPLETPGITVRPLWTINWGRTNETFYEDVHVPATALVGEENRGWYQAASALDLERAIIGSASAPLRRSIDAMMEHVQAERPEFADDAYARTEMARSKMDAQIARALTMTSAAFILNGVVPNQEASMSKIWTTETRTRVESQFMDMLGPRGGLTHENEEEPAPMEGRLPADWLGSVITRFGGGTNDIQRRIIATRGLGLPRG